MASFTSEPTSVSLFDLSAEKSQDYKANENIKTCGDGGALNKDE